MSLDWSKCVCLKTGQFTREFFILERFCQTYDLYLQIKLFCVHPVKMMMESKLEVHKDKTLKEATEMSYKV